MKQPVQAYSDAAGLHCPAGCGSARPANPGIRILILVSLAMLGLFVCAHATASPRSYDGAFTFTLENDAFTGSDSNYTNGLGFAWSTNELGSYDQSEFPARWGRFWSFLPYIGDEGYQTYASWTIGQQMHTPDDITDPDPPPDDQPYAGILYLHSVLHARRERWGHTFSLRLGVVGPSSRADKVQQEIHRLTGSDEPQGWHTQLPDEPVINVDYTTRYVLRSARFGKSGKWRVVPLGTVSVGNYFTGLGVGLYTDIGWNLPDSFATTRLRYGFSAASTMGSGPSNAWSVSFYAGISGFAVAHYLPLDGTVFRDSRSVDSRPFIGSASAGIAVRHNGFAFSLGQTFFTKTFEQERAAAEFGTLSMSWYY